MVAAAAPRRLGQGAWISLDGGQRQETATFFDMPALKVYLKGIRREYHPEHCLCCVSLPPGRTVKPLRGRWIHTKKSGRLFKSSSAPQWTLRHCSGPVDLDADADESRDAAEAASPTTTPELSPGDAELAPGDAAAAVPEPEEEDSLEDISAMARAAVDDQIGRAHV